MGGGRYSTFWRAFVAGALLASVVLASALLSRAKNESSPAQPTREAAVSFPALPPMHAKGCTNTWLKTRQTDWTVASNWSAGRVPVAADRVCVPDGGLVWLHETTVVSSIAAEGTVSLSEHAALELGNPAQRSSIETLILNQSKLGGRSPLTITGTFDWETGGQLLGPGTVTIAKQANASFNPGPGGKGLLRTHFVNNGSFDLGSGAIYVGANIDNVGDMHVVYSSPTGHPAGFLDLQGRPLPEDNHGTDTNPGAPTGTPGQAPFANP